MTINTKNIEALVDEHCSSIHPMELDRLLKKLDHEDLDVLRAMLEEVYESGSADGNYRTDMLFQGHYDKGYDDGYDVGHADGYDAGYEDGQQLGRNGE